MSSEEKAALELDALRALSGAEGVQKSLLAWASLGIESIESSAYLMKCRVKDHQKIVAKILDRRETKLDYQASDVTDIVGLRILTLYRDTLPIIVKRFIHLVPFGQQEPLSLFVGDALKDALNEVIIYTSDETDSAHELIVNEFENAGLSVKEVPLDKDPSDIEADVKVVKKKNRYSSIHVVVWCNGVSTDQRFRVPAEVQIRTAFEDVWSEISHQLQYKIRYGDPETLEQNKHMLDLAHQHLTQLKKQLDTSSQTADIIKQQVKFAFDGESIKPLGSISTLEITKLGLSNSLQTRINKCIQETTEAFNNLYDPKVTMSSASIESLVDTLSNAISTLEQCTEQYNKEPSNDSEIDQRARYYLPMEMALYHFWKARLLKGKPTESDSCINEALKIYFTLESMDNYSGDPIIALRISDVLSKRGDLELALDKAKEAVAKLEHDKHLSDTHYMRVHIPGRLGVLFWEMGERIKRKALELNNPTFLLRQRQDFYLNAIKATMRVYGKSISPCFYNWQHMNTDTHNKKAMNNLASYAMEYIKAEGNTKLLDEIGCSRDFLQGSMKELERDGIEHISLPTNADTVRVLANYFGDKKKEKQVAKKVLKLLEMNDWTHRYALEAIATMKSDALASLSETK